MNSIKLFMPQPIAEKEDGSLQIDSLSTEQSHSEVSLHSFISSNKNNSIDNNQENKKSYLHKVDMQSEGLW